MEPLQIESSAVSPKSGAEGTARFAGAVKPPCAVFFSEARLPTALGTFRLRVYRSASGEESIALVCGQVEGRENVPVRVHSACLTSETFGSLKCDCRQQLDLSLEYIQRHSGVIVYLHQEGRGIGLGNKIKAYALQQMGHDTISANEALDLPVDGRTYEAAHAILADLRVRSVRLMTNNPDKIEALGELGLTIAGTIPVVVPDNEHSIGYLETKRVRMGHTIEARVPRPGHRPFVHLNFAIRAPGTGGQEEATRNISCKQDWARVHLLRERYAAIAVGALTWLNDNPRLTAREEHLNRPARRQPDPIVFMGSRSYGAQLDGRRMFAVGANPPRGEGCIGIEASGHDLAGPLATLWHMSIPSMLVEGGPTLLRSFLAQGVADVLTIYVTTPSAELAASCAKALFPGLPGQMGAEPLGAGTLLSWSLTA